MYAGMVEGGIAVAVVEPENLEQKVARKGV